MIPKFLIQREMAKKIQRQLAVFGGFLLMYVSWDRSKAFYWASSRLFLLSSLLITFTIYISMSKKQTEDGPKNGLYEL